MATANDCFARRRTFVLEKLMPPLEFLQGGGGHYIEGEALGPAASQTGVNPAAFSSAVGGPLLRTST